VTSLPPAADAADTRLNFNRDPDGPMAAASSGLQAARPGQDQRRNGSTTPARTAPPTLAEIVGNEIGSVD